MSEYQYYDFRAMDRTLTKAEMAELRSISTRAVITSTSFTNHYEWGSLKADPSKLLERYFDAFLYVANWGTREFYLRLPEDFMDHRLLGTMLPGEAARARKAGRYLILGFTSESDHHDWDDGTGWMGSLMSLRSDLLRGDLRCLYLGWLLCAQYEEFAEDDLEPPVPAGLRELSAALHSLIEFLRIDEDFVEVAALTSAPLNAGLRKEELESWIRSRPEEEKNALLMTAVSEMGETWKTDLLRRFREQTCPNTSLANAAIQERTVANLLDAARARAEERTKQAEAQRAAEAARRKAEDEAKRARYLDQLAGREAQAWSKIATHIEKKQPNEYDSAVVLLTDLRDLAARQGNMVPFGAALAELRQKHSAKTSLLRRLETAKL